MKLDRTRGRSAVAAMAAASFAVCLGAAPAPSIAQTGLPAVTFGFEGVTALSPRSRIEALLVAAGLADDQVKAEPLLLKFPDTASRQNVTARFTFSQDQLTELLFSFSSDDASEVKKQLARWDTALRASYGDKPAESSTTPDGYQFEGWCVAPAVEVTIVSRSGLALLDYVVDDTGICRDARPSVTPAAMYKLPAASR